MRIKVNNKITEHQYIAIVHSSMIGVGVLSLAQNVSSDSHQQGWISVLLGGIYPIIVVLATSYIDEKMNHIDFWKINNKIYGKFVTYIIAIMFFIMYMFWVITVITGFNNVLSLTIVQFIPPYLILTVIIFLTLYSTIDGLTYVGRLCELFIYSMIMFIALMIYFIPKGSLDNVEPLISNVKDIIKAIPASLFSYSGVEISYISISFITNRKNTKKAGVISVLSIILLYLLNVFVIINALGWELTSKISYPLLYLVTTVHLPIIENFTTFLMFLWSTIIFKTLASDFFGAAYCLSKISNKGYKKCCMICSVLIFMLSYFFIPEYNRTKILDDFIPYVVGFGILWGVLTSIFVLFKTRKNKNNCDKPKI